MALVIVDKDSSGEISYDEFEAWWRTNDRFKVLEMSPANQEKLSGITAVYTYYDSNHSGSLKHDEFTKLHAQLVSQGCE
jgi:Ca2+-binding EF-hand superfamily protein